MNGDTPNQTNQDTPVAPAPGGSAQKPVVVDRIRNASNILVAISADPSIDQLAASIGLTLLLEKFKKNATAVFSGKVPSALEFLKPGERFEKTTDSLRDFIIAIDKSKADKLRYKVEDNVVKIFITPYKTSITEKDLQYNAGDFNVDLIIALGVKHQQDLDVAITSHGRIFHDAVVVSINNTQGGDFGIANWEEFESSSLSELVANLAPELDRDLLDANVATALLTGIVAETNRFSNDKTRPNTMNVSSTLLAAGADQQLVNQQLQSVMPTELDLDAGEEIKPTMSTDQAAAEHKDEPNELVVNEDGTLKQVDEASQSEEPAAPAEVPAPPVEAPAEPTPEAQPEPTPEPQPEPTPEQPAPADPVDSEAEAARKAVDDALMNTQTPTEQPAPGPGSEAMAPPLTFDEPAAPPEQPAQPEQPAPPVPEEPAAFSQPQSQIPLTQPMPPTSAQTAPNTVPPIGSEPAPLANSPADQTFTMPVPPSNAFVQAPPVDMSSNSPAPGSGQAPPPLPPPIMPPPPPQQG